MITTDGNLKPGPPKRGYQRVEYAAVKANIRRWMEEEIPDPEIALRLNTTPGYFYKLKKKVLSEVADEEVGRYVAAVELIRIEKQIRIVLAHMQAIEDAHLPPDERLMKQYLDLSRHKVDIAGARMPVQHMIELANAERMDEVSARGMDVAIDLNQIMDYSDRIAAAGIGSGMTKEERERELENMQREMLALGMGDGIIDAEVVDDDTMDIPATDSEGIALENDDAPAETIDIAKLNQQDARDLARECGQAAALGEDGEDWRETPGRWLDGKFVTFWHDLGGKWEVHEDGPDEDASGDNMFPSDD